MDLPLDYPQSEKTLCMGYGGSRLSSSPRKFCESSNQREQSRTRGWNSRPSNLVQPTYIPCIFHRSESRSPLIAFLRDPEEPLLFNAVDGTFPISFGYNYELMAVSIPASRGDTRCVPLADLQCLYLRWTMSFRQLPNGWLFHSKYGIDVL